MWTPKILNGRGWPGFLQNPIFFKAKIWEIQEKVFSNWGKEQVIVPENIYIYLPFLSTNYYKKLWEILIATNIYQEMWKQHWFISSSHNWKNIYIFKHGFASICRALKWIPSGFLYGFLIYFSFVFIQFNYLELSFWVLIIIYLPVPML